MPVKPFLQIGALTLTTLVYMPLCGWGSDLKCVVEMEVPRIHGTIVASVPARVEAAVTIGHDGKVRSLKLNTTDAPMANEIRYYLEHTIRYSRSCEGQVVDFVFSYVVKGAEQTELTSNTYFRPPNEFVIVSTPWKPVGDVPRKKTP